jgi:hypothetical protein
MEWLNIHTATLDAQEFVGSGPIQRATWLCLLRYCVGQENGGRIAGCKKWKDSHWQQLCRVTLREIQADSELLAWDGEDLNIWRYPLEKEHEIKTKREAGRATANKRWGKEATNTPNGTTEEEANRQLCA